jgi:hypothetical protein
VAPVNRLRAFWLPATHPLTSHCTLETAKQHALGVGAWAYSAVGVAVGDFTLPGKWPIVGLLFLGLLTLMSIELLTGYATLPVAERKVFQWSREIIGKILLVSLVAVSLALDGVIFGLASAFEFNNLPVLRSGWPFVTCTTLLWLVLAQAASTIEHVRTAEGPEAIPPTMGLMLREGRALVRKLGRIDRERFKRGHPGEEPPGRWHEHLSDEQLARILAIVEETPGGVPREILEQLEGSDAASGRDQPREPSNPDDESHDAR